MNGEDTPKTPDAALSSADETLMSGLGTGDTSPQPLQNLDRFPVSIWFILSCEFCERFSYYGLRAILFLYLTTYLRFSDNQATGIYHFFVALAYFSAVPGGIISDSKWGKFKTIYRLSIVYCIGSLILSFTAIPGVTGTPPHWWGCLLGLLLIAIGTGGIKPCVSAFGGDQFQIPGQESLIEGYFAYFYFSINFGSLFSTFLTPVLRVEASFFVAFLVPAVLLLVALFIFIGGSRRYRKVPPGESIIVLVWNVVTAAFRNQPGSGDAAAASESAASVMSSRKCHWLDSAKRTYPAHVVEQIKHVFTLCKILLPVTIFWTLFDQHGSRWIAQAGQMNRSMGPNYQLTPDQMPVLNPLLVLIIVPLFSQAVFPLLRRLNFPLLPLNRMIFGMFTASLSFVLAALVQMSIDSSGDGVVSVWWQLPQYTVLGVAEVLVSVTGLEFAYSQAPVTFKAVIQSVWLLTVAFGNIIVAVEAESEAFGDHHVAEYFFFSILMFLFAVLFLILCRGYRYVEMGKQTAEEEPAAAEAASEETMVHSSLVSHDATTET